MTHYHVLGVSADADEEAIRSAFRGLARRYHPDAGEGSSVEQFRQVVEAYETLTNPQRRRLYDLSLQHAQPREISVEPMSMWPEPLRRSTPTQANIRVIHARPAVWIDPVFHEAFRMIDDLLGPMLFRW